MLRSSLLLTLVAASFIAYGRCRAEDNPIVPQPFTGTVQFERDVLPIFKNHCFQCHGPEKQKGKLRLDSRDVVLKIGGQSGPAAIPNEPTKSHIFIRVAGLDEIEDRMPPKGEPLTARQVGIIEAWIKQGAEWPEGVGAADTSISKHWAYVKPQRPALPKVSDPDWCRNPIDDFILAKLDEAGLKPSREADKAKLLRRVHLDLIGLPPSVEEVDAFLRDDSPNAYETVVDRLLASPRYGEKWARHWLDLARYADSNGFQADQLRDSWPYRDWVIRALNADLPFDRFTIEQIAGDMLPGATVDQRIATGFHRTVTCNVEAGVHPEANRTDQIFDRVSTTATVWLGTTMECAQCHNHKYDPFTMRDYYGLFAYFNNTPLEVEQEGKSVTWNFYGPKMELPLTDAQVAQKRELETRRTALQAELDAAKTQALNERARWEKEALAAADAAPQWHVLDIAEFRSSGGASHEVLPDKSLLIGGEKPSKDVYTLTIHTELTGVTALRLEALTHESLPGNGPGRHHPERPNFVLYEFDAKYGPVGGGASSLRPLTFRHAEADFSQSNWPVRGLIDGKSDTGWAINPQFGKPHFAVLYTDKPTPKVGGDGARFVITLPQHYGDGRTIGRLRISAMTGDPATGALPAEIVAVLKTPAGKRTKAQRKTLDEHFFASRSQIKSLEKQVADIGKDIAAIRPHSTLVMVELDEPRATHVLKRGDYLNPGERVEPDAPAVLHPVDPAWPRNRIGLAKWLVDPDNPLVGRVTVNRWWGEFFGRSLVESVEDFGAQADPPTHPKLLDWLAVEFVEGSDLPFLSGRGRGRVKGDGVNSTNIAEGDTVGSTLPPTPALRGRGSRPWSIKHVHKLIVMSATYRQSSAVTPRLLERDPGNELYARGPRFRLSAEAVRDNALAIAGLLSEKMHGPPVMPPQPDGIWRHVGRNAPKWQVENDEDRFRRGIYIVWRRSAPYPSMVSFDAPDRASCTAKRPRTNTPLQALTLLNDPAYVEMALALAHRVLTDRPSATDEQRIEYGLRLCTSRRPSSAEARVLERVLAAARDHYSAQPKAADALIAGVNGFAPSPNADRRQLAAWFHVANVLLNLDETITKE